MFPFPNRPTLATLPSLSCVSIISSKSPSLAAVTHIGLVSVRPSFPFGLFLCPLIPAFVETK